MTYHVLDQTRRDAEAVHKLHSGPQFLRATLLLLAYSHLRCFFVL